MYIDEIYKTLLDGAREIAAKVEKVDTLSAEIESGVFSDKIIRAKMDEAQVMRREIDEDVERVNQAAKRHIDEYISQIRRDNDLRGEDLTDDIKLLNCGVKLTEYDILPILQRNRDNRTMVRLICRYCAERNIPTGGFVFDDGAVEIRDAESTKYTVDLFCRNWIRKTNSEEMLRKFFQK